MRNRGPWIPFYLFLFPLLLLTGVYGSAQASDPGPILPKKPSSEITSYQSRTFQDLLKEGVTQYRNENFDEALEIFLHARERFKDSSVLSYYLGLTYKQLGEYKKALGYFKESVHLRPSVLDAAILQNTKNTAMALMKNSAIIKHLVEGQKVKIAIGVYRMTTGKVELVDLSPGGKK